MYDSAQDDGHIISDNSINKKYLNSTKSKSKSKSKDPFIEALWPYQTNTLAIQIRMISVTLTTGSIEKNRLHKMGNGRYKFDRWLPVADIRIHQFLWNTNRRVEIKGVCGSTTFADPNLPLQLTEEKTPTWLYFLFLMSTVMSTKALIDFISVNILYLKVYNGC